MRVTSFSHSRNRFSFKTGTFPGSSRNRVSISQAKRVGMSGEIKFCRMRKKAKRKKYSGRTRRAFGRPKESPQHRLKALEPGFQGWLGGHGVPLLRRYIASSIAAFNKQSIQLHYASNCSARAYFKIVLACFGLARMSDYQSSSLPS